MGKAYLPSTNIEKHTNVVVLSLELKDIRGMSLSLLLLVSQVSRLFVISNPPKSMQIVQDPLKILKGRNFLASGELH